MSNANKNVVTVAQDLVDFMEFAPNCYKSNANCHQNDSKKLNCFENLNLFFGNPGRLNGSLLKRLPKEGLLKAFKKHLEGLSNRLNTDLKNNGQELLQKIAVVEILTHLATLVALETLSKQNRKVTIPIFNNKQKRWVNASYVIRPIPVSVQNFIVRWFFGLNEQDQLYAFAFEPDEKNQLTEDNFQHYLIYPGTRFKVEQGRYLGLLEDLLFFTYPGLLSYLCGKKYVNDYIQDKSKTPKKVCVAGVSLGGAMVKNTYKRLDNNIVENGNIDFFSINAPAQLNPWSNKLKKDSYKLIIHEGDPLSDGLLGGYPSNSNIIKLKPSKEFLDAFNGENLKGFKWLGRLYMRYSLIPHSTNYALLKDIQLKEGVDDLKKNKLSFSYFLGKFLYFLRTLFFYGFLRIVLFFLFIALGRPSNRLFTLTVTSVLLLTKFGILASVIILPGLLTVNAFLATFVCWLSLSYLAYKTLFFLVGCVMPTSQPSQQSKWLNHPGLVVVCLLCGVIAISVLVCYSLHFIALGWVFCLPLAFRMIYSLYDLFNQYVQYRYKDSYRDKKNLILPNKTRNSQNFQNISDNSTNKILNDISSNGDHVNSNYGYNK